MGDADLPIIPLGVDDAGELLTLQRAAYVTEAQLNDDPHLPPLVETLDEVRAELADPAIVVAGIRDRGRLIAAFRVRRTGPDSAEVGRLAVAPDRQGEGLGSRILLAAEAEIPGIMRLTLFTGEHSERNLHIYRRHGYVDSHTSPAGRHTLVHLEKRL